MSTAIIRRVRPTEDILYCVACKSTQPVDKGHDFPIVAGIHTCGTDVDIATWDLPEQMEVKR